MRLADFGLILLLTAVTVSAAPPQAATATEARLAFVNTTAILQGTAEGKKELAALEAYISEQEQSLESQTSELAELRRQYDSQVRMLNPETAAEMQRTIQEKERRVRRAQEDVEMDITRRRNELLGRMSEKIQAVIAEYAQQEGLGAVFLETPALPYFAASLDITAEIIGVYDQKNPVAGEVAPATTPASSPSPPSP